MATQYEDFLNQTFTGESEDPFEYYSKPWKRRYPYVPGMFPSMGLDMGNVPFGGALTGGESGFYPEQGQSGGGQSSTLSALMQILPKLAQTGMKELMPSTVPNAKAVFPVDEGMAELPQPTMFNTNAELYGVEPWMTEQYPSNFQGSIYDIPKTQAVFPVDEGMAELPIGGGGGIPEGYLPSGNPSILGNIGSLGSGVINVLTSLLNQKTGTPIPGVMGNMLLNPMGGLLGYGMGSTGETGRVTSGIPKILQTASSFLGPLGGIVSGMLSSFGKTPESPYMYYDPATRGMGEGIQLGEPLDQFGSASKMWSDVWTNPANNMGLGQISGFDPYSIFAGNEMKEAGIWDTLNPIEQYIFNNYNALFNQEQTQTTTGGPSPYQVNLASQGR